MLPPEVTTPLVANTSRQADATIRGFYYQFLRTVEAWLDLSPKDVLYVEMAEDIDKVSSDSVDVVQVKDREATISLGQQEIIDAIESFWNLRGCNPKRSIRFRYLTTADVNVERGQPFGKGISGIALWNETGGSSSQIAQIKRYLLARDNLDASLKKFLTEATDDTIYEELIGRIRWVTGSICVEELKSMLQSRIADLCNPIGVSHSDSLSVFDALIHRVMAVAASKLSRFLTREDLHRIIEHAGTTRVSVQEMRLLQKRANQMSVFPLVSRSEDILTAVVSQVVKNEPASVQSKYSLRTNVVSGIRAKLISNRMAIIYGSTGMGKTTLAALVAQPWGAHSLWLRFSDLTPDASKAILLQLERDLKSSTEPVTVVLDDFNLSPRYSVRVHEYLNLILRDLRQRGHIALLTTQWCPSDMSLVRIGISRESVVEAPRMNEDEIAELLHNYGCTDAKKNNIWKKVISAHTVGHPQLAHARIISLSSANCPDLAVDELLKSPREVEQVKSDARQILMDELSDNTREFVYHLSMLTGAFRRIDALEIARSEPNISLAADWFDRLVGPWIEHIAGDYYRLSPLLTNAATAVYTDDELKRLHSEIAKAIPRAGNMSTIEASSVFFHAFLGNDAITFIRMANSLLFSEDRLFTSVAERVGWIVAVALEPPATPFPDDVDARFFFRHLQFRVAAREKEHHSPQIVRAWDAELKSLPQSSSKIVYRYIFLWSVISQFEAAISPKELVGYYAELVDASADMMRLTREDEAWKQHPPLRMLEHDNRLFTHLGRMLWVRKFSTEDRVQLVRELRRLPEKERTEVLSTLTEASAKHFVDWIWRFAFETDEVAAKDSIRALETILDMAVEFGCSTLSDAAIAGLSVLWDERLKQTEQAIELLERGQRNRGYKSRVIDYHRAIVHFNHKEYEEALAIFEKILPTWTYSEDDPDARPAFGWRWAAICAGMLNEWLKSTEYFTAAYEQAGLLGQHAMALGLLADATWVIWKDGHRAEAVEKLISVLEILDTGVSDASELDLITLKRTVSNTLLWMELPLQGKAEPQGVANPLGLCSTPERNEAIRDLPTMPDIVRWVMLSTIEFHLGLEPTAFQRLEQKADTLTHPTPRFLFGLLKVQYAFRHCQFDDLPCQLALMQSAKEKSKGLDATYPDLVAQLRATTNVSFDFEESEQVNTEFMIAALLVASKTGLIDMSLLSAWRDSVAETRTAEFIASWAARAESVLLMSSMSAFEVLRSGEESNDRRLLAAVRISIDENARPDDLLYAQLYLLDAFNGYSGFFQEIPEVMEEIVTRTWTKKAGEAYALRLPSITASSIAAACRSTHQGWVKASRILLAAHTATAVNIPARLMELLKSFS